MLVVAEREQLPVLQAKCLFFTALMPLVFLVNGGKWA
jgi:hypothetical protein